MWGKRLWHTALLLGLGLLVISCGLPVQIPGVSQTSPDTPAAPTATPTARPTPLPSSTPRPCPVRPETPRPAYPGAFGDIPAALQTYLTAGGDPQTLPQLLDEWLAYLPRGIAPVTADLTGDGRPEVSIAYVDPQAVTYPPTSALAVYTCRGDRYNLLARFTPDTERPGVYLAGAADLNADGRAELAPVEYTCGAHTCWDTLHVWTWEAGGFRELLGGDLTLPYATYTLTDGQILAVSGGIGSVGAGPQRAYTETWAWNGSVITRTEITEGPATFRYHVFVEGDQALDAGRYPDAYAAYSRVLRDETLQAWAGQTTTAEERAWLNALAHWRLLLLGIETGNFPDAEAHYTQLTTGSAPTATEYPVVALARRFWQTYQENGNVGYACVEVVNAAESEAVLAFLNGFGYANPTYAREGLCPFLTP